MPKQIDDFDLMDQDYEEFIRRGLECYAYEAEVTRQEGFKPSPRWGPELRSIIYVPAIGKRIQNP